MQRRIAEYLAELQHLAFGGVRESDVARISHLLRRLEMDARHGALEVSHMEYRLLIDTIEELERQGRATLPPGLLDEMRYRLRRLAQLPVRVPVDREREEEEGKKQKAAIEGKLKEIGGIRLEDDTPALFFLGAGASKPEPSSIPTVDELLEQLWTKSKKLETNPLSKLEGWCSDNDIRNIEEMLTGITIARLVIKNPKVHGILSSVLYPDMKSFKEISIRDVDAVALFDSMVDMFFSLLVGTMLTAPQNAIHEAIADFVTQRQSTNIITTNYDACIDRALYDKGIASSYVIGGGAQEGAIPLIKMHGSINWFYCETCQNVMMPTVETMLESVESNMPYSVTGMCGNCKALVRQFIIPPTAHKYLEYPPIVQVWDTGRKAFEEAKVYIIIGYSFSDADDYIAKMLLKAVGDDPSKHLIIIDKSPDTIERFKSYIKQHAESFDEKNIHDLQGPAEELTPSVLHALEQAKRGKAPVKSRTTARGKRTAKRQDAEHQPPDQQLPKETDDT